MVRNTFVRLYRWLLRILWSAWRASLPPDPTPDELTARYLHQRDHFAPVSGRVKPRAFHPAPKDHKTSVFRISGLSENEIWRFGEVYVAAVVERKILARAEVSVGQVDGIGLRVETDEPPPRHANITGWASEKDQWMSQAQELAALATLRLPNRSA